MSLIPRVAVTGAGHPGSRPTDKQAAEDAEKHADTAVFEVAADSNASAETIGATAQDHGAAACTNLPAVIPAMNTISPSVSSRRHYKIAGEFLEAGIHDLREKYRREKYLREIHSREHSIVEIMGATTNLPTTTIILHLIDDPVERLAFNDKFPFADKVNRTNINTGRGDAPKHRYTPLKNRSANSDFSLEYQSGLPSLMRWGQRQSAQRVNAAIRGCA